MEREVGRRRALLDFLQPGHRLEIRLLRKTARRRGKQENRQEN
jgi:hypothetical protein